MIRINLDVTTLGRVRITYSPLWELSLSLRVLVHDPQHRLHAPWLSWVRPRIDPDLLELLRGLAPGPRAIPDFLTPVPHTRPRSIRSELAALAGTDLAQAQEELECDWDGRVPEPVAGLLRDKEDGMRRLTEALESYWKQAIAPVWPGVRAVLTADVAYRADLLAANGLHALLNRIHPTMSFNGQTLFIDRPREITRDAGPDGVVLVPCVFGWPYVLIVANKAYPATVSYAPRGAGLVWQERKHTSEHPTAELIGRGRAAILTVLELPMGTTQLAEHTEMSPPAVSQHLAVLRRTGLVTSRRVGRTVLNTRTRLGDALIDGHHGE